MSLLVKKDSGQSITPAVHLEFIQNQAGLPDEQGADEVEAYHRALFLHHHAGDLERFQQQARIHSDRLAHIESRLKDAHAKLSGLDRLVPIQLAEGPDVQPTSPWNHWDRAMFAAALLGIIGMLVFGILNISFNLLESGLVTFVEHPIRAYFWAALLPVGALAVKIGWDFLASPRRRGLYLWCCLALGVAGVVVWVAAYASVYPALSKTVSEHIESMSVFDNADAAAQQARGAVASTGAKWVDIITVAAQAVAEIFLSAVLGIYMTVVYNRHRPVRLAGNPLFVQLDQERVSLEGEVERERLALAEAQGNQTRLENQLTALVAYAKSMFQKEALLRRDQAHQQRTLLDQISGQLRTQLAAFENGHPGGRGSAAAALGNANGK